MNINKSHILFTLLVGSMISTGALAQNGSMSGGAMPGQINPEVQPFQYPYGQTTPAMPSDTISTPSATTTTNTNTSMNPYHTGATSLDSTAKSRDEVKAEARRYQKNPLIGLSETAEYNWSNPGTNSNYLHSSQ